VIRTYFTIAFRNLMAQKVYALINILGLSIGMAAIILIALYVQDEFSYNQQYVNADRIVRVLRESKTSGATFLTPQVSGGLSGALENDYPEVEYAVNVAPTAPWVEANGRNFKQNLILTEPRFFDLFNFEAIGFDPKTALGQPESVLLTRETATKFFDDANSVGETVTLTGYDIKASYVVTGVIEDIGLHSSINFDLVTNSIPPETILANAWNSWASAGSQYRFYNTWVLLKENVNPHLLEPKVQDIITRHIDANGKTQIAYRLQPLLRARLYTRWDYGANWPEAIAGDIETLIAFLIVGTFVLGIACVNYVNLTTARAARRAREVGLRKVVGSSRAQLVRQFLGESVLSAAGSALIGLVITQLALPTFNSITNKQLELDLFASWSILPALGLFAVTIGFLSGAYPALFLSGLRPAAVIKGDTSFTASRGRTRQALVIVQFACSVIAIIGTLTVRSQIDFIRNKDLGFDRERVVEVPILWESRSISTRFTENLAYRYQTVQQAFLEHPAVTDATAQRFPQGTYLTRGVHQVEGSTQDYTFGVTDSDENFFRFFGIELVQGRLFKNREVTLPEGDVLWVGDRVGEYVINETGARILTSPDSGPKEWGSIVGICEDFHTRTLHNGIEPLAMNLNPGGLKFVLLRVAPGLTREALAHIEKVWDKFLPTRPFMFTFMEDRLNQDAYSTEIRLGRMLDLFSGLAIFISCLGLLGLVSYTTETRTKEIGIRKVIGAPVQSIIRDLTKDFLKLILIANVIAWPFAYFGAREWLNGFSYRIDLGAGVFVLTAALSITVAVILIGYHTTRAALADPVKSLRNE
jgi:putative ABC transport system permease protein